MVQVLKPDICIIGAGSAGLSVAAAAAAFGVSVVLVEKGRMGGDCLNYGCVPSKALIAAARAAHKATQAERFGIAFAEPKIDFRKVHDHIHGVIASIAPNDSVERFTGLGVQVIQAEATFRDERTVIAGDHEIRARRFVIATGSSPLVPEIPGVDAVPFLTNETIFNLIERPAHLLVIGGGPIGLELAQAYRRLGSEVTVVEAGKALAREDPELAEVALRQLRGDGVTLHENTKVVSLESAGAMGVRLNVEQHGSTFSIDGTHLLVAAGRKANVHGLNLDAAGVAFNEKGVRAGSDLRTTNRRVYAIGDVAGQGQFTHLANYHAGLILRPLLFRLPARVKPAIVPRATFLDPELAQIGLTEEQARAAGGPMTVLRWHYAENDRAQAERATDGLIKIVAGKRGRILGVGVVGANAAEMMNFWSLAVARRLTLRDIAAYVAPYPTYAEIGKRAAISYFAGAAHNQWVRRLVRLMARFG